MMLPSLVIAAALVAGGEAFISPMGGPSFSKRGSNHNGVQQQPIHHQSLVRPLGGVMFEYKDEGKDEAEKALKAAQAAIQKSTQKASSAMNDPEVRADVLASAAGGALLGAGLGVAASMGQPDLVDPAIVPAATAAFTGTAAFTVASQDDEKGNLVREWLGKPTQRLGQFLSSRFQNMLGSVAASVASIPDKIAGAVKKQVEKTKVELMSMPDKVMYFLKLKVDEAAEEAKKLPQKLQSAAVSAAEDLSKEIQAAPGRAAESAKKALEQAADETKLKLETAVEEAKSFPERKVDEIVSFLEASEPTSKPLFVPHPPKTPPPLNLLLQH